MKNGDTDTISDALKMFGDQDSAAKWFGHLNTKSDGSSVISDGIMDIFQGAFKNIDADSIKKNIAKGAKAESSSLGDILSDGIGNLVGGVTSFGSGISAVLGSVAQFAIPLILGGLAIHAGKSLWNNVLTNNNANKKYEESSQKYDNAVSERDSLQSEYNTNKERYYELNAKENRSTDEQAELENLASKNSLMESQLKVKDNLVDATQKQQALDAKDALEKSGLRTDKTSAHWYENGLLRGKTGVKYQDDIDEANDMIEKLNRQKAEREELISNESNYSPEKFKKKLASIEDDISTTEGQLTDSVADISDKAQDLWDDNGNLIDESARNTAKRVQQLTDNYKKAVGSTSTTSDKMNNIFALSQFSDLKDKLIAAGKSGGTDAIQKMIDDTDGLKDAMNNAGLTADDLKDSIMSIADPDAKNLEGIKENLEDIFGKDGLGQSDFFKGKTDKELENFWDYLQDNNYNPKQMKWNEETTKKNFEAAQEAKKKTPEESATFASKFKNAAEDTATDIDTVTDNFQSDMKNIQSAMESVTNGTFQNSDMADLIQQFPELSNASGDLKDNLQDLAMDKGAEAIGKIRDSVKDVTDPKQLAQADKYVQSIMDTMDMSDFDFSEKAVRARAFGALTKDSKNAIDIKNKGNLVDSLMEKYSGNETAMQAIVQLSMDPSMADATMEEWEAKIEDQEVQIKINADTKELDNLSKSMTRLQTDASNTQTDMSNKAAFNQKVNKNDYDALIKNGDAQIKNYDEQIAHYKNLQETLKENNIDAESTEQWKQWQDNIDAAQQSIENMKASQAEWGDAIKNLPITDITNLSSAITTAMSEMQSDTGLTTDSVKNLATQFSDLGDINIDSLYTRTAKGLQLNTDRLQDYMEQQNDFVNSDFENKVKDQKKIVEDTFKAYQNGDKSLADYTAEQDALDELLNRRNQYFARYQEAQEQFTDFQKMQNAKNAANAGDEYTTAKSDLENLKDLYDKNLVGTKEFKKGSAYFSQNGFEDPENFIENYNHLKKYYTDDSSGPQKFLEDLNKKGLATYETLANGQKQWAYSFNDVKDAADQMGMSYESFQSILGRLSDYGFVNNLVTSTQDGEQQIDELTDDLITEKNKLSKLKANGATDQAIQDQENVVDQLESKISGVNQAVTDYANGETDRKVQDLKEAKQIIKDSKEAYDEAMKSGDTDLAQKLRKNIQDTAKDNDIELTPELNIDEKALDKQIDNLQSEAREKSVQKYKDIQDQLHNGQTEWTDSEDFNAADTITKLEQAQSENAEGFNNLVSNMKKYNLSDLESMIFGNGAYESENQGLRDMEDQIQGFAESIGLTADQTNMLVPILEAMGTLDISPKVDNSELEKTVTDAQTAEQTLEETTGKQYNFDFNTTDLDTIQKQVNQVKKDIEDTYLKRDKNGNVIRDENGIPTYDSATFLSCLDKEDSNHPVGLEMNVHEANFYSSTDSLYFPYSEEDIIEYEFNINALDTKTDGATSIIMVYEDGVGGRPMIYNNTHRLHQHNPLPITIGCDDCDVYIYRMKAYSASLNDTDILSNFIADARDSDEMISRYERNQIYDDNNSLTPESVAKACPNLRVIKIEAPHFTNDKKDYVKNTSMQCIYTNGDAKLDNWKYTNCYHAGQGTTSNEYGFAARNIDVICCADGIHQITSKITLDPNYKTELVLGDGTKYTDGTGKIALTRNSVPNNWFNFKVNVASSEMANNALLQKRFNDYLPYSNPGTRRDSKVKNSMEFINCVIFIKESDPDISTHREFKDTDWHFYSLGNMGDSKKTDVTRAYNPNDMKEFCIEISDNTLPNSAFQTGVANPNGTMKYPISKDEWKAGNTAYDNLYNNWDGSFEFRYDCCGDSKDGQAISSDEEKTKIRTKNKQIWRDFYEFVITSSDKDFVDHLGDWMIEDAALYLYLFTLRYTMIDNRAKNVFPHWAKHYMSTAEAASAGDDAKNYTIDDSKAAINNGYRFDFWDYDNDSAIGINNSGELTMSYGKEDTDYKTDGDPSSGYIFNAAESVLWCRIRDLMQPQLRTMYQSVDSNCWSAEHLINEFDSWQEQFPEELWRIHYERLYLRTYQAGTVRFLQEMMNGRKKYQRRQWERDQHAYMGTKFVHTDVKSDQIMFRCNTPKEAVVKPNYTLRIVPYSDMYISVLYGNSANPAQIRAKAGQEYEVTTNLTNMDDTAVLIYCASRIQALNDLSACYIHDNDFSKATKLKTLIIGNSTKGYQNTFLTNLNMGNNILLEELNVQNCPNLTGSINLSACENLIKLNTSGTVITSVSFATHGKIKHAYLPSTINTLAFKDLQELTDLVLPSYENLETFVCRNSVVDALDIIKKSIKTLKTVTVTGINWNLENTNILKVLAKLTGKDENEFNTDHSILTGTIHLPVIRDQELKEYIGTDEEKGIWTELEITYDSLIVQFKITCVNADKAHTVLDVQYVDKGSDGEDPITRSVNPIPIPTIPSTIENDFIYKRWDSEFTKVFADRTITAVYEPSVRNYNVEYILKPTPNAAETVLQSSVGPYGSTIEYTGDLPKYTAEEAAYKYYLFKEWDKSGLVTGNKKIYTVFDSCEYSTGYFDGKDLENLSEVELYTLMKMNLERDKTEAGDTINFKLGIDYDYNDVKSKEFISETTEFDGTNYIDTKVSIMDKDRDFTFAIDFEFGSENISGATLAQCFQSNGSNGFRLWYNSNVNLNWGTKSMTPSGINDRELVVIRHKAGSEQAYVYCSNLSGNEVSIDTLAAIRIPVTTSTLVFGCSKADDGSYEKYAKGKIHWAKLWYSDLGDNECREIASWIHETIPMMVAKYKEYYLSDNATKRANITFIAKNLLSTNHSYGNITGGWSKSSLNTWLNTRLIKAVSPIWKSLIKKVNVTANNADKAKTTSTSECYFYLPSIHEIEPSISNDPYSIETDSTISYMTNDIARRRAKVSTPDQYEAYPTRSANVDQNVGTWQWGVDGGEDTPGKINGYYYPQTAGVLIMFSISCEG